MTTFTDALNQPVQHEEYKRLMAIMQDISGETPVLWESAIIGFRRYTTGKSCLDIQQLAELNAAFLRQLIAESVAQVREKYPD